MSFKYARFQSAGTTVNCDPAQIGYHSQTGDTNLEDFVSYAVHYSVPTTFVAQCSGDQPARQPRNASFCFQSPTALVCSAAGRSSFTRQVT